MALFGAQQALPRRVRGFKRGWIEDYIHYATATEPEAKGVCWQSRALAGKAKC